ncbi:ABC transporter ATP-binding protein [Noviherbaspirillum cavernae]|uniref:ABC transporter ATP-binding protein n=1 Tax=Noviherbaspirillum cavernae TaxID=2320862 RepID=A0A418X3U2_9BURK|nr:ABC transporter ATP-binding protein [Noviherbaspirillum cavernae]RJG07095.1 ABC transporter ATP-binding protein [Noviherbaspirillum cavernae]
MIEAKNIHVVFKPGTVLENHALQGASLSIPAGQFVTVIGTNGAGKSTFLNVLAGVIPVSEGKLTVAGQDITRWPVRERARLLSRVFQDPLAGTCEQLTIEENMALALKRTTPRGLSNALRAEYRDRFRESLSRLGLGLENRLHDQMGLLSGGQRQAVSLLMATLAETKVLLLDEHTAALDPKTADFVMQLTDGLVREKKLTVMMVTHSMRQALDYGDRTVMFHKGNIAFDVQGEKRSKFDVPDLLRLFSESCHEQIEDDALLFG